MGTMLRIACTDCSLMSPLESQATDEEMWANVELCNQYAVRVNKHYMKINSSAVARTFAQSCKRG